jgi:formate hydrogenlyase subunit 3/multisubunit Na+/H+ antiporter MnhD subunit
LSALVAVLALPLAGALAAVALPGAAARAAALASVAATAAATGALLAAVARNGEVGLDLGGWAPPLGIALRADGLAALFLALSAAVMAGVALAARRALAPEAVGARAASSFWPLALMLWAALNAVFVSRDLFNLYVGLELISLAAIGLVALSGKPEALAAAMRYMLFALTGSLLYLAGVVLIYAAHGALDIGVLAARAPARTDALALALMTGGLLAKTALFPFHVWLPPAHAGAPAPASALLSGLVPKASFVILLRLWGEALPGEATEAARVLVGTLGAAAVIWGGLCALVQARAKLIVAYSTVAQIGYLFVVWPLLPLAAGAWGGVVLLALAHGMAKAAMFLAVGQWAQAAGSDRLDDLAGLARAAPMGAFAFALAAVSLAGLPPSAGFTGKYLVMQAGFAAGQPLWAGVMLAGGLLAAAYLYRPLAAIFAPDLRATPAVPLAPVPRAAQAVPLALAGASVALGLASAAPLALLGAGPAAGQGGAP